jgi:DNA-binding IscR family transcriptional regulator
MQLECAGIFAIPSVDNFCGSRVNPGCDSLLFMAKSGRFGLSLRILTVLAAQPDTMHTSAVIAKKLAQSAVMVRRCFLLLHKKGLIEQRKGPNGGAKLKLPAKQIGLGDIYAASEGEWLVLDDPAIAGLLKRVREEGVQAMNETSLAQVLKRIRKNTPAAKSEDGAVLNKKTTA